MATQKIVACLVVVGVAVLVLVTIVVLLATSLKNLSSDEVGLAYDTINKNLDHETKTEGLHNGPPGFKFIKFPSVYKTLSFTGLKCLNKDGVIITMDITYQHKVQPDKLHNIVMHFRDFDGYKTILTYTGESAVYEACGYLNISQFRTENGVIEETISQILTEKYESLFCNITDLKVNNIALPPEYESAINRTERAREDLEFARRERQRLLNEDATQKKEANTPAQISMNNAHVEARNRPARATAEGKASYMRMRRKLGFLAVRT